MFLILAAYLGGVLTILSPCILPVLPFVGLSYSKVRKRTAEFPKA
jgi:cytochrome c biogenesis protein CcdA